jgi:hypothetical protein
MSTDAEALLMATGLLETPERTHILGASELVKAMREDMTAALDREDPGRLILYPPRVTYFDRLSVEPDYAELLAAAETLAGGEVADAYVAAHQRARRALLDLRPRSTIDTVMGPVVMPLDAISQGTWDLLVDVVEGCRLVKDLAAGALLAQEVQLFQACFPDTYRDLRALEDELLNKHRAKKKSWVPEPWMASSLLVFEGRPPEGKLSVAPGTEPEPGRPTKEVKVKDLTKDLETASRRTGP